MNLPTLPPAYTCQSIICCGKYGSIRSRTPTIATLVMWFDVVMVEDSGVRCENKTVETVVVAVTCNLSIEKWTAESFALFYDSLFDFEFQGVCGSPCGSRDGFKRGVRLFLVARPQKTTGRSLAAPHSESIKVRCCAQDTYFPTLWISNYQTGKMKIIFMKIIEIYMRYKLHPSKNFELWQRCINRSRTAISGVGICKTSVIFALSDGESCFIVLGMVTSPFGFWWRVIYTRCQFVEFRKSTL